MLLDMSIDRLSLALICGINSLLYPELTGLFLFLICLDCFAHMAIILSSLITGSETHKLKGDQTNRVLRLYYGTRLLFWLCFSNELFSIVTYISAHSKFEGFLYNLQTVLLALGAVGCFLKQITNIAHLEHFVRALSKF